MSGVWRTRVKNGGGERELGMLGWRTRVRNIGVKKKRDERRWRKRATNDMWRTRARIGVENYKEDLGCGNEIEKWGWKTRAKNGGV